MIPGFIMMSIWSYLGSYFSSVGCLVGLLTYLLTITNWVQFGYFIHGRYSSTCQLVVSLGALWEKEESYRVWRKAVITGIFGMMIL